MTRKARASVPLCPSAQPEWEGAVAIGVVGGTAEEPRLQPLEHPLPVTKKLLALSKPVRPTEVFRFAAPCLCNGCSHFSDANCGLATKIVQLVRPATDALPECDIRPSCRWFGQEGREACMRCPRIVTNDALPAADVRLAGDPRTPVPA